MTPFIAFVEMSGAGVPRVRQVSYSVKPKPGSASKAVSVSYARQYLVDRGYTTASGSSMTLPTFGLYQGYANDITVQLTFDDGTTRALQTSTTTASYVDPTAVYDRPTILTPRAAGSSLGFDFFYIKSGMATPVVVDTDGEVRWVGLGNANSISSVLADNAFVVGDQYSLQLRRLELDGSSSTTTVISPYLTHFHHDIGVGKVGLLAEMDASSNGAVVLESNLVEIGQSGVVLKSWDLAAIISSQMRSQGDDPTVFVRGGVDWFHMNSAIYDARDDSLIVSSRENFVIKIDYETGSILWILGDPTKYWYTFPSLRSKSLPLAAGGVYPAGQHGLSITPDGLLMLFDNGYFTLNAPAGAPAGDNRTFSAVRAYSIDAAGGSAREEWRFDHGQTILSDICSNVVEASDQSLLVNYATAEARTKARIMGLDPSRQIVFDLEYPTQTCTTSWNARPIAFDNMQFN